MEPRVALVWGGQEPYVRALTDWLACAAGGWDEPAAQAARALPPGFDTTVVALGTAGHVLDFDDTFAPGLSHVTAPLAPVVLALGSETGASTREAVAAFAAGFEASAALAEANHPTLRERGWHPTSVCGALGAAIVASRLLGLSPDEETAAVRLSILRASGLSAAFGSDGKSLQVGFAAAAGASAARLARAGATAGDRIGFEQAYGGRLVLERGSRAIDENWIKAYPCCLQTHSAIECGLGVRDLDLNGATVEVHPVSLRTAAIGEPRDGLEAKFSVPYLTAYAWLRGEPTVESFAAVNDSTRTIAAGVRVETDASLLESEARLVVDGQRVATVEAALGSPLRPMDAAQLDAKVRRLAGDRFAGAFEDPDRPIASIFAALTA